MHKVTLHKNAAKYYRNADKKLQGRINTAIDTILRNPRYHVHNPFRANALLETFSNRVNEPPHWKVEDFLTGFTLILSLWKLLKTFIIPLLFFLFLQPCFALTGEEIQKFQPLARDKPVGERIAFWAEKFIGVPYDTDPLGEYVSKATIVADERVDCMYLTFRAVELALSHTHEEAIQIALEKRFHSRGVLKDGQVTNYDDRFEYGEDMIESGKWGEEVTSEIGKMRKIEGSRGRDFVEILPSNELMKGVRRLKTGDIIFFVKRPEKRKVGEIVGHIGIIRVEKRPNHPRAEEAYLIHASGMKGKDGVVKKVLLKDYLSETPFIGVRITRF